MATLLPVEMICIRHSFKVIFNKDIQVTTTEMPRTTPSQNEFIFYQQNSQLSRSVYYRRLWLQKRIQAKYAVKDSIQFQMEIRKVSRRRSRFSDYAELGHFTSLFCRGR